MQKGQQSSVQQAFAGSNALAPAYLQNAIQRMRHDLQNLMDIDNQASPFAAAAAAVVAVEGEGNPLGFALAGSLCLHASPSGVESAISLRRQEYEFDSSLPSIRDFVFIDPKKYLPSRKDGETEGIGLVFFNSLIE